MYAWRIHVVFEKSSILFPCHTFAWGLDWSSPESYLLYHDSVHTQHSKNLAFTWRLVNSLNKYKSINAFNTIWNIREQENLLTREKINITDFNMAQMSSEGSSVVFPAESFNMTSLHLQISAPLCAISLQHLSPVWRWRKHSSGLTWAQYSGILAPFRMVSSFPSIILIQNNSGPSIAKCLCLVMILWIYHVFKTKIASNFTCIPSFMTQT